MLRCSFTTREREEVLTVPAKAKKAAKKAAPKK